MSRAPARNAPPGSALARLIEMQRDRWLLWLPAAAIVGAALWLSWPADPPRFLPLGVCLGATLFAWLIHAFPSRTRDGPLAIARAVGAGLVALLAALALGAAAAEWRTESVRAPRLDSEIGPIMVEGWVADVEQGAPRTRLRLLVRSIEGLDAPPIYVRVTSPGLRTFTAGRAVRCRAILRPPDGPIAPGAYDFARRAYFERLGASGFTLGHCRPIALEPPPSFIDRANLWLAAIRADMADAIYEASPGIGGAVAASIVVGDRSRIDEETNEALFNSGLGHILSVSGLHMSIAGGVVYAALAALFSLIPFIALRVPVPKLAAAGALAMLTFYLFLSGASVPAQRAYVMAAVALGAKLMDRPAISMRGLGLAALVIVLWMPESVMEPGFQMSFAATAALVAAFEAWDAMRKAAPHLPTPGPVVGSLQGVGRAIGGALLVSFVAGLATDPFALYHFQRFSVYGLPANLAVAPLVSFVMAPAAALAAVLAPFGLAELPLQILAAACDLMVGIGRAFAERPEALRALPKPPDEAFLLAAAAITWGCLWRGALRWLAAPALAASAILYALAPRPVMVFDSQLRALIAQHEEGDWRLIASGRSSFARDRLGAMLGHTPDVLDKLAAPSCTENSCRFHLPNGAQVLLLKTPNQLPQSADATLILAPFAFDHPAPANAILIDAQSLAAQGGAAIYMSGQSLSIRRAQSGARRPWTPIAQIQSGDALPQTAL